MGRWVGLDRLRAAAMLLGVVYHATYAFIPNIGQWFPIEAASTSSGFGALAALLHIVRMPVFFMLSGFFAALVMKKRETRFLHDRFQRLVVPFVVAVPISIASDKAIRTFSLSQGTMNPAFVGQAAWLFRPLHLWFLEYLFLFCCVAWLGRRLGLTATLPRREWHWVGFGGAGFCCTTAALLWGAPEPAFSFLPQLSSVIFFGAFFAAGWLLHDGRGHWGRLPHIAPFLTAVGLIIATGLSVTSLQWTRLGFFASSLAAWLSSVGLMGLALRPRLRGDVSSPTTTFLVQSAYWVYLIHHPLVQLGQALVAPTGWPALLSYAIVVVGALALSCASFAVLVRPTPLARYLAAGRPPVSLEPVSAGSHTLPAQPASSVTKDV